MCKRKVSGLVALLAAFLLLAGLLVACGEATPTAVPATTAAATTATARTVAATTAAATTAAATTAAGTTAAATTAAGSSSSITKAEPIDRKIIRNASLYIYAGDIEQTLTRLRDLAVTEGGIVFSENTSQQKEDQASAVIVLQIPTQNYERVITAIHQAAIKVTREESTAQDVTDEYVDLQSQIANFQRTEQGLQKLMDKATKMEDVLNLQRELSNVRGEIEKRQGRLNFLDKRSSFSTITVNLTLPPPPPTATPTPLPEPTKIPAVVTEPPTFNQSVNDAWSSSLKILGTGGTVAAQIIVFLWWLLPLSLVAYIWWRIRRLSARKAESSARQWENR